MMNGVVGSLNIVCDYKRFRAETNLGLLRFLKVRAMYLCVAR